ncbi:MAG: insulinase family protein [SAR202 cluster bacterium]|nr:hypothetical protein [Chloroflexota bacterium]MQG36145.1 insulinase family protein [SAR202 cluster bacterium]MQG85846.1 insulinase family protein [SAR202 cluster bacterium]|tara:strand:+ start:343 stop:1626 length:1284 start_codon:yes stop_codon:yes gene_type:complete
MKHWNNPTLTTLDNGLRVITHNIPGATSVSANICVQAGSKYETCSNSGVSHFLEHMLFKGTKSWPTPESLSGAIENIGGEINALTSKEYTMYWAKVPYTQWKIATNILLDMCMNPLMESAEIDRERNVIHEELRMYTDHPSYQSELGIDELMFPEHPMGREIVGSHESLEGLKQSEIQAYFYEHYNPSNLIITITGNFPEEELIQSISGTTNSWIRSNSHINSVEHIPNHIAGRLVTYDQISDHTYINLGIQGLEFSHSLSPLLNLTNIILGEGMSSRLFIKIREELGLAYDISSSVNTYHETGTWLINCSVKNSNCMPAVEAILEELYSLTNSVTTQELLNVRQYAKGKLLMAMEDTEKLSVMIGVHTLLSGTLLDFNKTIEQWDSFTVENLHEMSRTLITNTPKFLSIGGAKVSNHQLALEKLLA